MLSLIDQLPPLRDVIANHDLLARKSLGQHFLCDLNLTKKIASLAGDLSDCTVFEVGPGPGGLTRALLGTDTKKVIAIEKDRRCIAALQDVIQAADGKLEVIEGDALKIDFTKLAKAPRAVVANLPYNIGTELLLGWLEQMTDDPSETRSFVRKPESSAPPTKAGGAYVSHTTRERGPLDPRFYGDDNNSFGYRSLTLMFQSEVADRMAAAPDSKTYGRLSVIAQFCCDIERVLDIPARAFTPPPKVDSAVVHLTPRKNRPKDVSFKAIERVTHAAFGQRRKMLRSSLKPVGGEDLLKRAGIKPELRAENLSVKDFEMLARLINY